jgi:hypothetical protein
VCIKRAGVNILEVFTALLRFNSQLGARGSCPGTLASWEAEIRRIAVQKTAWANGLRDPISKLTRAKWTGGVAQNQV